MGALGCGFTGATLPCSEDDDEEGVLPYKTGRVRKRSRLKEDGEEEQLYEEEEEEEPRSTSNAPLFHLLRRYVSMRCKCTHAGERRRQEGV